jgi:acyl-CoA thioesterase
MKGLRRYRIARDESLAVKYFTISPQASWLTGFCRNSEKAYFSRSKDKMTPEEVTNTLLSNDRFSEWLGLIVDETGAGSCRLHYVVRDDMTNGFGIIHGGVLFSAADSALAFACNSHGILSVALDVSITFTRPAKPGETLFVHAEEIHKGNRTALYDIRTTNEAGELVSMFKGTSYRTGKEINQNTENAR